MHSLVDRFAVEHPASVLRRGGDTFIDASACLELIDEAERWGVRVLGLEGFLVDDDSVFPALSRIADFSAETGVGTSCARARALLTGPWQTPPTSDDQMLQTARGRNMVAVVLSGE
jgi:hypothetical protein